MSPRHRLGVALLLDPPGSVEVDGLRRALGDSSLEAVAPHLTLVPPVNVRSGDLGQALGVVRRAAAVEEGPLDLDLGPVATFVPASPVVYLAVGGADLDRWPGSAPPSCPGPSCDRTGGRGCRTSPSPTRPWPRRPGPLWPPCSHYRSHVSFDRVVVLEEKHHRWHPLADAALGPPAVVGRGGLELEITEGRMPGPDVMAMAESQLVGIDDAEVRSNLAEFVARVGSRSAHDKVSCSQGAGRAVSPAPPWPGKAARRAGPST